MSSIKWMPLESNPDVMNKYLKNLGVCEKLGISDVVSLEDDLFDLIPKPSYAILLLFPVSSKDDECCKKQDTKQENVDGVYFMKQTIRNACGTVALIHALANNEKHLNLKADSVLKKFLDSTRGLSPEERGRYLEQEKGISAAHESSAQEGQTEIPDSDDEVDKHFLALVNVNGKLVELDGRKPGPVVRGSTTEETFLKDAFEVCKEYIRRASDNLNFSVLSFGAK